MRVLHVTPAFFPATYWGGPIFSTYALCNELTQLGVELKVLTTDTAGPRLRDRLPRRRFPERLEAGYPVYYCAKRLGVSFAPQMCRRLLPLLKWADVIHLTAIYSAPTLPVLLGCRALEKPVIWSPRGALQTWEGSRRPTMKSWWAIVCRAAMDPNATALHVTSSDEETDSKSVFPELPTILIPNGVDVPDVLPRRAWRPGGALRVVFMGRLDPKKGIENLIAAVSLLHEVDVNLSIYGAGSQEYEDTLRSCVRKRAVERRVVFKGHVEGTAKQQAFLAADIVVVPSFTENFGLVVAEALAHAVPVVASTGTPWRDVTTRGCGLWVDNSPDAISEAIRQMHGRNLEQMGRVGREWMMSDFSWKGVAARMKDAYASVLRDRTGVAQW